MNAAQLQNNVVVNIAVVADGDDPSKYGLVACGYDVGVGWTYDGSTFSPPPFDAEAAAYNIRVQRDRLLYQCDWTMLPDAPPEVVKADWEVYRQALRNITDQPTFPESVVWPTAPFVIGPV